MASILILRSTEKPVEELAVQFDRYLEGARAAIEPFFDGDVTCSWNAFRNRITVAGGRVHAEVVLIPTKVIVLVDLPAIWFPFKRRIEERVGRALDAILAS